MTLPRDAVEEESVSQTVSTMLPSWLASLVVHLTLVLLLALLTFAGDAGWNGPMVELDFQANDDGPQDDALLAAAIEMPSELTEDNELEELTPQPLEPIAPTDIFSKIELVEPGGNKTSAETVSKSIGDGMKLSTTSVFGLVDEGSEFVYVFDRSDSMNSEFSFTSEGETVFMITPLKAAKAELMRSIKDLDDSNLFHILFYNHEVWKFDVRGLKGDRLVLATPPNKRRAANFVASVYGSGRTRHVPPLEAALRMSPNVIFLLTDGEEKDDPSEADLRRLRKLNGGHTRINVIQFCYKPRTSSTLAKLAEETGGKHIFMDMAKLGAELAQKQLPGMRGPTSDDPPSMTDLQKRLGGGSADPDQSTALGDPQPLGP